MSLESNVRTRAVSDPVALRALAHPIRLRLWALVGRAGTLTAADAAKELDISHALASHHLRQLAKYGYLEPADAPDGRAHPWRVTATSMAFPQLTEGARAPVEVIERHTVEQALTDLIDYQQRRAADPEADPWGELAGAGRSILYLTPDELAEVKQAWLAVVAPRALERPLGHAGSRPPDAVPVSLTLVLSPLAPTVHGG